ncbi:MAG TPA: hypothetical protein VFE53_16545 [Mucilaginibacter sp.]|jgi:hypothetical protein|nr:hypothetical protein [Mucilaginibacter sp.]
MKKAILPTSCWLQMTAQAALGFLFFSLAASGAAGQSARQLSTGNDTVWRINLKNDRPTNCGLQFTQITRDNKGGPILQADSRGDKSEWNGCVTIPKGILKAKEDYILTFDYEVVDRAARTAFFYVFARSNSLGYGADQSEKWSGEPGERGKAKLRISPAAGDYYIQIGIHGQAAIRIQNITIVRGNGWTILPLTGVSVGGQQAPAITGAQRFTVEAPAKTNGPVINLGDFGLVADGGSPPSTGPDRNLMAFKAAIAKCRETKASKLIVPKGVYRITSGETIAFEGLSDFIFDGGGSTFLFHQINGRKAAMLIKNCTRTVFSNFNIDWDWKIAPLASVGRILKVGPNATFFDIRFETPPPLDPRRWVGMNPLDEKLRAPGTGTEFGVAIKKIDSVGPQTLRVWTTNAAKPVVGQLYLLRHYTFEKNCMVMEGNKHLSFQYITIYSFPGNGFNYLGDQDHFELLHCRITYPENERRCITLTGGGFMVSQSQGFIRLEDCDFGYTGDDLVDIGDNVHAGVRRVDDHTLVAENITPWQCPFNAGDMVEVRNGDFSPTGFTAKLEKATGDYKTHETTLVFDKALPGHIASNAILLNHRYNSHNCIIRNCYFHENRARVILCLSADWLIEGNRFFHDQYSAIHLIVDVAQYWAGGFGAQNIIVRNNKFESINPAGEHKGSAIYVSADVNSNPSHYPLLQNLLLENNTFTEMTGPAVEAASFRNLVIRQNTFINREKAPIALKMRGAIRAELGSGLWVEGNNWTTKNGFDPPAIFYDAETTKNIVCSGNLLKN